MTERLHPHHREELHTSGLTDATIACAGLFSASAEEVRAKLGFNSTESPGLAFPYPGPDQDGCPRFVRIKPDRPPTLKGKVAKYLSPQGSSNRLYIPPEVDAVFQDASMPLYITEGEKKALKAAQEGLKCVGLVGVWGWKGRGVNDESAPIPDLDRIQWAGRTVFIVFDSDATAKRQVRDAERALAKELQHRGATVRSIRLPADGSKKVGLDDFLCLHPVQVFLQLPQYDPFRSTAPPDADTWLARLQAEHLTPRDQVSKIRKQDGLKPFERKREVARTIIADLQEQGALYRTPAPELFFFSRSSKALLPLKSPDFARVIAAAYGINRSEEEFTYFLEELETEAHLRGELTEVRQFSWYDSTSHVLYISNNQNQIYRLDGRDIALVDNGTDRVLFRPPPDTALILPDLAAPAVEFHALFEKLSLSHSTAWPATWSLALLKVWVFAIFFAERLPVRPILTLLGDQGAGKSSFGRLLGRVLYGPTFDVSSFRIDSSGEQDFLATICERRMVIFDNADQRIPWLPDHLAKAATGADIPRRQLYTTNTLITFRPICFLALTSRDPRWKRDDVVRRLLPIRMETITGQKLSERQLQQDVLARRPKVWGALLCLLNQIVEAMGNDPGEGTSIHRLADFHEFGRIAAPVLGCAADFERAMVSLDEAQLGVLADGDERLELFAAWADSQGGLFSEGGTVSVKTSELLQKLKDAWQGPERGFPFHGPEALGQWLKRSRELLLVHVGVVAEITHTRSGSCWKLSRRPVTLTSPPNPLTFQAENTRDSVTDTSGTFFCGGSVPKPPLMTSRGDAALDLFEGGS